MSDEDAAHKEAALRTLGVLVKAGDTVGHDVILTACRTYEGLIAHLMKTNADFAAGFAEGNEASKELVPEVLAIVVEQLEDVDVVVLRLEDEEEAALPAPKKDDEGDRWKNSN